LTISGHWLIRENEIMRSGVDEGQRVVEIWTAKPSDIDECDWVSLMNCLDARETGRMMRMRYLPDRQSYLLAHALMRIALAETLEVLPGAIDFVYPAPNGRGLLEAERQNTYFSLSRSRKMVACAVTRVAPIGVDVESIESAYVDMDMLADFVELPGAEQEVGPADGHSDPVHQFFFYWTVLEAYWKARGAGLSSSHPRMQCRKGGTGYEVTVSGEGAARPSAWAMAIQAPPGMMLSVVLDCPPPASGTGQLTVRNRGLDSVSWRQQTAHPGHCPASLAC
jgi:4'-phosphopantetheinyl transferase